MSESIPSQESDETKSGHDSAQSVPTSSEPAEGYRPTSRIKLNSEFRSFLELRDAIERYQKEKHIQLIVKDSKLLEAESTRKVIPKVWHLVNQKLMYHSITYCCKCHGVLKQKEKTRIRNVGQKRLNCPMYFRLKLTPDLRRLRIFDMNEMHNHDIDPNTAQMPPRQQVYKLSRMRQGLPVKMRRDNIESLIATAIRDVTSVTDKDQEPELKRLKEEIEERDDHAGANSLAYEEADPTMEDSSDHPEYNLDSDVSFSDSDEDRDELSHRRKLPYPIRLIGAAVASSPELLESSKELIELQKSKLLMEKQKIMLQTRKLELENAKLELEVDQMEKNLAAEVEAETDANSHKTTVVKIAVPNLQCLG